MAGLFGAKGYTMRSSASDFLKSILQNGVGRPVIQLKRITLKFCPSSVESRFVRKFVENDLINFANKHPSVVCYALPEADSDPTVLVEFLNGTEEIKEIIRKDNEDIATELEEIAMRSGRPIVRMRKEFHTDCPSIQGEWHPFTNQKDYDITEKLDFSVKSRDAWEPLDSPTPWKRYYRKSELHKLKNLPQLTFDEKANLPLGKWGPPLKKIY